MYLAPDDQSPQPPAFNRGGQIPPAPGSEPEESFDGGMYYVDFGPAFGQELQRLLRYDGLMTEIVFWRDQCEY